MMLSNLIDEVRSRRVLAFAAVGVLLALAIPLLFLKSAPEGAPAANAPAPAAAEEAKLPERAARLLATDDGATAKGQAKGSAQDPFSPPAAYRAAVAADAAKAGAAEAPAASQPAAPTAAAGGGGTSKKPVEVVVTNPGARTSPSTSPSTDKSSPRKPSRALTARNASVDIRYGPKRDTPIKRAIPRNKAFYIHGKLVAVFAKYSPSRDAAVFAVAPGVHVAGVKCRVKRGACRYVDIPAGKHAWLTIVTRNRIIVSRRLDIVRIKRRTSSSTTRAASANADREAACLARKLVAMNRGDALLGRHACKR